MSAENLTHTKGRWTKSEHERYKLAMAQNYGSWAEVAEFVGTRSANQCRSHHQKVNAKSFVPKKPRKKNLKKEIAVQCCVDLSIFDEFIENTEINLSQDTGIFEEIGQDSDTSNTESAEKSEFLISIDDWDHHLESLAFQEC
ncbi:unnamed protein product [Blepharisma stoltei]|uniref:Uncharacterized protein n=1 Tax=Blepharisma stoltei TaxID=1481888 RepID=A0AAU9J5F9_9CILI|nr:unnamed protein product [Blepharisma stoltei]